MLKRIQYLLFTISIALILSGGAYGQGQKAKPRKAKSVVQYGASDWDMLVRKRSSSRRRGKYANQEVSYRSSGRRRKASLLPYMEQSNLRKRKTRKGTR